MRGNKYALGEYSLELCLCQSVCLNIGIKTSAIRVVSIFISDAIISIILHNLREILNILELLSMIHFKFCKTDNNKHNVIIISIIKV